MKFLPQGVQIDRRTGDILTGYDLGTERLGNALGIDCSGNHAHVPDRASGMAGDLQFFQFLADTVPMSIGDEDLAFILQTDLVQQIVHPVSVQFLKYVIEEQEGRLPALMAG